MGRVPFDLPTQLLRLATGHRRGPSIFYALVQLGWQCVHGSTDLGLERQRGYPYGYGAHQNQLPAAPYFLWTLLWVILGNMARQAATARSQVQVRLEHSVHSQEQRLCLYRYLAWHLRADSTAGGDAALQHAICYGAAPKTCVRTVSCNRVLAVCC